MKNAAMFWMGLIITWVSIAAFNVPDDIKGNKFSKLLDEMLESFPIMIGIVWIYFSH